MKMKAIMVVFFAFFMIQVQAQIRKDSLTLETPDGDIYGTLLVPPASEAVPVALIIAGSGPTDRNGNNPMMKNNSLKMLAEGLADGGVASLRYDKRGIAESAAAGGKEENLRFEDYIKDAEGWIKELKADSLFSEVVVVGHSEGSLIGMIAAQEADASKFISLSGAGLSAGALLQEQIGKQAPLLADQADTVIAQLEKGKEVDTVPQMLYSLFRPSLQPYLISWFQYDPVVELEKLAIPVLIMQGTTDLQVEVTQAKKLAEANTKAQLKIIEGMNHILKEAPEDAQSNMQTYTDPDLPLKEGVVNDLLDFITQ